MRNMLAKEKEMFVSKLVRSSTIIAVLALGLAGCSDGLTAPQAAAPSLEPGDALLAKGSNRRPGSYRGFRSGRAKGEQSRTFTIYPNTPVFQMFGDHILTMPANAACDPATSGYGSEHWDLPCARATEPIEVTATWGIVAGRPAITFSPDLRFAPADHRYQWVNLSLRARHGVKPNLNYVILWYDPSIEQWIDESATDPTLIARPTFGGTLVTRRLKHFSDYSLWVGFGSYNVTSGFGEIFGLGGW